MTIYLKNFGLWQIFVGTAFPIHIWAIILLLRDIAWVAERTNYWDAAGVVGYGLVFSLVESLLIWIVLVLIGSLMTRGWPTNKRVSLLTILFLLSIIWIIIGQFMVTIELPIYLKLSNYLFSRQNPGEYFYGCLILIISPSVLLSAFIAAYSQRFQIGFLAVLDRITPLMILYLGLDGLGLMTIIIRNFQ